MSYVPRTSHPQVATLPRAGGAVPSVTVHALKENKRPVGFAPWPEPKPVRNRKPKPKPKEG